jgi:hypothetical protein
MVGPAIALKTLAQITGRLLLHRINAGKIRVLWKNNLAMLYEVMGGRRSRVAL